jgi:hypothetical protein
MNRTRLALYFLVSLAWLGVAGPRELAAQLVARGPELDLLADTWPNRPVLAVQPDGAYLVAWDEGSPFWGVFYRYVAAGSTPKEEWPSTISDYEVNPYVCAVTATPKGFDVLWQESDDRNPQGFFRYHLNLRGVPDGKPIPMGGAGTEWVWHIGGNRFMAGWTLRGKHGIAARYLASSGQRTGPELRLNSRPVDNPEPVVLAVADGGFLAVWRGVVRGSPATLVLRARRFSREGKPLGPDFDINTIPLRMVGREYPYYPYFEVAAAPGGGFAVAWMLDDTIYLRYFDAAGTALGPEVPTVDALDYYEPEPHSMAFDKSGNLLLLYLDYELRLQLFDPQGARVGGPVGVRSKASGWFEEPWGGIVAGVGNSWLVTWGAAQVPARDFSAVFVRRFARKK